MIYFLCLNGVWSSDHPTSLLDLDYALYSHLSFVLGKVGGPFHANSVDVFTYHGNWYSASAPGTAILAFPFAALGFYLEGGFSLYGWVMLLSEAFVALANALAVLVLYRILKDLFSCREHIAAFVAFAYAFSTISWPFATYFFQSDVSSLFVLLGVYFALKAALNRSAMGDSHSSSSLPSSLSSTTALIFCGLSLGVALTVDYVTAVLLPIFLAYVAVSYRGTILSKLRGIFAVLASWGTGLVFLLCYNYTSFGIIFTTSEQLYLGRTGIFSSFSFPLQFGLLLNFLTPLRGLLLYSPILAAGVWGLFVGLRREGTPPSMAIVRDGINRKLSLLFLLALFLGIVIPYSMWYSVTGGISYGPRFLVPAMPLLLIPFGAAIGGRKTPGGLGMTKRTAAVIAYGLFAAGVVVNGLGAIVGAVPPDQAWLSSPFLHDVLPDLARGQLDTWWTTMLGHFWPVLAAPIMIAPLLLAAYFLGAVRRRRSSTTMPDITLGGREMGHASELGRTRVDPLTPGSREVHAENLQTENRRRYQGR